MSNHVVTLNLPGALYDRAKRRAEKANRPVEAELLDVLTAALPATDDLPPDLAAAIGPLPQLDDDSLWRAARSGLASEVAAHLEALHDKQQREGLSDAEAQTVANLISQYERAMLVRARAAALLKQRGHDVSQLLTHP
jgi:plasmid stability protein